MRRHAGFATAAVLGLLAIAALLSVSALHDALFGEQLASSRLLHQRAAALAEAGIEDGIVRSAEVTPAGVQYTIEPLADSPDSATVSISILAESPMPAGFSSGRFRVRHLAIESTAHTVRGVRVTLAQGVTRIVADTAEAPPAGGET